MAARSGTKIFNAGMRGGKGTPYQGGTRAAAFFRWPAGGIPAGMECDALSAHIDIYPDPRRDHRREAVRRGAEASRRAQPVAAAQEPESRVGRPYARASRRPLGKGQGGGVEIRQVRHSKLAASRWSTTRNFMI